MSRTNFEPTTEPNETLDTLIPMYASNKLELDSYKKLCDRDNEKIKKLMADLDENTYVAGIYKATRSVQNRETLNEEKLLEVCKKHNITGVIETKEVVNMEALEDYLYKNTPSEDLATDLNNCKSSKEVVTLRVTSVKE